MRNLPAARVLSIALLILAAPAGCGDADSKAKTEKDAAKRERDKSLLTLEYPKSTGTQPRGMQVIYDEANDRTTTTLRLDGFRISGSGASQVSNASLHFTSGHKGRVRASDNPEGSIDAIFTVQTTSPGILAFSGPPGTVSIAGTQSPLRKASGDVQYGSAKAAGGREEVRFRFPTELVVAAANSEGFQLAFASVQVEVAGQHLADFRELAASLNPRR